jgi:chemotaxis protein methyltransferase CheR
LHALARPHAHAQADTSGEFGAFFAEITAALGLSEAGYRRTRGSVRKRLSRRLRELDLAGLSEYRAYLATHAAEWGWVDACCRITISRWWRDGAVFDTLAQTVMPELAAAAQASGRQSLRLWSAGCASGEEPYSLALSGRLDLEHCFPNLAIEVLGTDANPVVLARAARGAYPEAALRELPERLREQAFERRGGQCRVLPRFRAGVRFEQADLRAAVPEGLFDLICCRNVAFTYFDTPLRRRLARSFAEALRPGGALVVGLGERLPEGTPEFTAREPCIYARASTLLDAASRSMA